MPSCGDWTVIFCWDKQDSGAVATSMVRQKLQVSSILGVALNTIAAGNAGTMLNVNPGAGEYSINSISGTTGTSFDHSAATPIGVKGVLYNGGVSLSGVAH